MPGMPTEAECLFEVRNALAASGLPPDAAVLRRLDAQFPALFAAYAGVYGAREDGLARLSEAVVLAARSAAERPADLRALDAAREADPDWFQSQRMVGGVCYVDRYAGTLRGLRARIPHLKALGLTYLHMMPLFRSPEANSDGGYAVSSYREVDPRLGTMEELTSLCFELRAAGISPVIDFIFNHTSDEHAWARAALAGDPEHEGFYWIFPDRTMPDAYERTTREIFPDDHPGSFVRLPDGRWIWSTFLPVPVGPELPPTPRCSAPWRGRCCSSPIAGSRSCGWTPSRSSGSGSAPPARACPRRIS